MTTQAIKAPAAGFSMKKLILRLLVLGFVGVTVLYAKTIGLFVRVFVKELFASSKKT